MPNQTPRPVQFPIFRKEQLQTDEGMAAFNLSMSQIVNAINQNNGQAGAVVLPSGVDVQGSSVTGLGTPTGPTDAVSLGHSNTNYGAPAVAPQLDIGGKNTLKGLAYTYSQVGPNGTQTNAIAAIQKALAAGVSGTVTLAKITGGGSNGSLTFVKGIITAYSAPS